MTVLVLGATGFIGPPLVRALIGRGETVVAASRRGGGPGGVACDRADARAIAALAQARGVHAVVDLLAFTTADTLPLFDALAGLIGRWVMVSSMDVYGNYEGLHRKARPAPVLEPVTETSALRRSGLRHAILRLPMTYGPGDRQQRFAWILGPMLQGRERLVVDPAWAAWRTTYGFVADVADAIAACACRPDGPDGTFNLGDPDPPDHRTWIDRFAAALDWRGAVEFRPAPPDSPVASLDLAYPVVADTRAFRAAYGWSEPTPLPERLAQTIAEQRARAAT